MDRIPLLKAIDGSNLSRPSSPVGTPRSPLRGSDALWNLLNFLTFASLLMVFSCFAFTTIQFYKHDMTTDTVKGPNDWQDGSHKEYGVSYYQACQVHSDAKLPILQSIHLWTSQRRLPKESITVVTQLSLDRLAMLRGQCRTWGDRISAAVYVPYIKGFGAASLETKAVNGSSIEDIVAFLDEFHEKLEEEIGACALDLELVMEKFNSWDDENVTLYPFNALRNRALMLAKTEAIVLLDVDFLPSQSLPKTYQNKPASYADLLHVLVKEKAAYVLPAFETQKQGTDGRVIAKGVAKGGKMAAVDAWNSGNVAGFQVSQYPAGHSPTKFEKWMSTDTPYDIEYLKGFEPYIMISRRYVPWYDERFRGYGRDKIVHLTHLAEQLKIKMRVHGSGFVIHSPHAKSSTFKTTKETGQWDALLDLYVRIRRDISIREFVPVTSFAKHCLHHITSGTIASIRKKKLKSLRDKRNRKIKT